MSPTSIKDTRHRKTRPSPPAEDSDDTVLLTPAPPCPPGYRLHSRVGHGGMGEVWKALDLSLGRVVALKFLRAIASEEELARFRREAELASRLDHSGITTVYGVGQVEGRSFIAMRYVEGTTLERWPRKDVRGLVRIVRDAAAAVQFAHSHGILHRDIKPSNILIEQAPGGSGDPQVVVTDFGLAKWLADRTRMTQTAQAVGTPPYMSPEQVCGDETDCRTDVYSLGATLHEALTGKPPFSGANALQILRKVLEEQPARISGELGAVVARAMEKDRRHRYATAAAFAADLDRWLSGRPVNAPAPGALLRLRRRIARRPLLLAGTLAAGVLLAVGLGMAPSARPADGAPALQSEISPLLLSWVTETEGREEVLARVTRSLECRAPRGRDPQAWLWLGRCRRLAGRSAAECWDRALRAEPGCPEAVLEECRERLDLYGMLRGADLGQARAESPEEVELHRAALLYAGAVRKTSSPLADYLAGFEALRARDAAGAEAAFTRYLSKVAWDGRAYILRARARSFREQYAQAESDASHAAELSPKDAGVAFLRGRIFDEQSRFTAAEREYGRAGDLNPAWAAPLAARAVLYERQGMVGAAEKDWRSVLRLNPRDADALVRVGDTLVVLGCPAEAEAKYTMALRIRPDLAAAWFGRAQARRDRQHLAEAEADLTEGLAWAPLSAAAFAARGDVRQGLGRLREAVGDWRMAGRLDEALLTTLAARLEATEKALGR